MGRILLFSSFCVPQIILKIAATSGFGHLENPLWSTLIAGAAVVSAATMLAWACEMAETDITQGLALAIVALVAVLPEYAMSIYFAWRAGSDPSYAAYATANMTGANRMLIGLGWSSIMFLFFWRTGKKAFDLDRTQITAIWALLAATAISLILPLRGAIGIMMGVAFLVIFFFYLRGASSHESEEKLAEPYVEDLIHRFSRPRLRGLYGALFFFSALAILASAESFAEGMLSLGRQWRMDEYLLVQWLAPLASEAPELIVALMFAWRLRPKAGLTTLISSKVNQWTLLVGMLPIVYALSIYWHGHASSGQSIWALPLDARQTEELFLTSAQSIFATIIFCNFNFSLFEAVLLLSLFCAQLMIPGIQARWGFAVTYLVLSAIWIAKDSETRRNLVYVLKNGFRKEPTL